jgi:hypothetical protein
MVVVFYFFFHRIADVSGENGSFYDLPPIKIGFFLCCVRYRKIARKDLRATSKEGIVKFQLARF